MIQNPLTGKMIKRDGNTAKKLLEMYKKKEIKLSRKTLACLKGGASEGDAEEAAKDSAKKAAEAAAKETAEKAAEFEVLFNKLGASVQFFIAKFGTFTNKDELATFLKNKKENPIQAFNNLYGALRISPPPINSLFDAIFAEDNDTTFKKFNTILEQFSDDVELPILKVLEQDTSNPEENKLQRERRHDEIYEKQIKKNGETWCKVNASNLIKFEETWNQVMIRRFANNLTYLCKFKDSFINIYPELETGPIKTYSDLVNFVTNVPMVLKISKIAEINSLHPGHCKR